MKAAEARKLIGKQVAWDEDSARYRFVRHGLLQDVKGRNVLINDDWKWMPYLKNFREQEINVDKTTPR